MLEQWLSHQLQELAGVPIYWVGRFAKVLQFIAGLVIIVQIIGEERLDRLAQAIRTDIKRIIDAAFARKVLRNSFLYFWYFFKGMFSNEGKDMKYWQARQREVSWGPTYYIDVLCAILFAVGAPIIFFYYYYSNLATILISIPVGFVAGLFVGAVLIPIFISIATLVAVYPIEALIDTFMKFADFILGYSRLSRIILYLSFILFVAGMLLDFIAS